MSETKDTRFNYTEVEARILKKWEDGGCYKSAVNSQGEVVDESRAGAKPFVIAIPPPNVTGRLHMGHALNNTMQDMYIRFKRMDGYDALWIPGTDHAGIATQTVVKKKLDAEGVDYRELGREKFTAKIWEWKDKYGNFILKQLKSIGASCDWDRTRFTMDDGLYKSVMHTFKKLYDEGLIYRGKRIVNWCPVDQTALSDDEVETKDGGEKGFLWHIKYPLKDGSGHLIVATTRPETLFGDVAVAVHPEDERFKDMIGKEVIVPLQERVIKVIADDYVDKEFGTGCLKITPAHDANDFEVGNRHSLTPINVMNVDATMNDVVPERYRGLDRFKCREKAIEELKEQELLVKEEERMTPLGRSYRSKAVIEYRLSDQWFVKMDTLAQNALDHHSELNILPKRWDKVYLDWLNNIRDWCISRQIWWGHRIPAWYHKETGEILVEETTPQKVLDNPSEWEQETDVLDTWFSSALWPMSTLGWPEATPDFDRYFPTSTLITGKDIIFFWVARMNFMALHFTGKMPYQNVFINPIVLDDKGETMSKSKGNGVDPLVVINGATLEELKEPVRESRPANLKEITNRIDKNFPDGFEGVGADALRYTLVYLSTGGQQLRISLNSFHDIGRRFVTKLWNAARFIMMYMEQEADKGGDVPADFDAHMTDEDRWIHLRLHQTAGKIRESLAKNDFNSLGSLYYQFVWNDFCDWYIELCKVRLTSENSDQRKTALHSLATVFAKTLQLLHPMVPFVTEELWEKILPLADQFGLWGNDKPKSDILMMSSYPESVEVSESEQGILDRFELLQNFVSEVRTIRKRYLIKDAEKLKVSALALNDKSKGLFESSQETILRLANLESLNIVASKEGKPSRSVTLIDADYELYLEIADYIDVASEKKRLQKEVESLEKQTTGLNKRLQNKGFVDNAKPEVITEQRELLVAQRDKLAKTQQLMSELSSWG